MEVHIAEDQKRALADPGAAQMMNGDLVARLAERDIKVAELAATKTS